MKGRALVGQIRYPWIGAVGASCRARGSVDAIHIRYAEKYPDLELHKMLELLRCQQGNCVPRLAAAGKVTSPDAADPSARPES